MHVLTISNVSFALLDGATLLDLQQVLALGMQLLAEQSFFLSITHDLHPALV